MRINKCDLYSAIGATGLVHSSMVMKQIDPQNKVSEVCFSLFPTSYLVNFVKGFLSCSNPQDADEYVELSWKQLLGCMSGVMYVNWVVVHSFEAETADISSISSLCIPVIFGTTYGVSTFSRVVGSFIRSKCKEISDNLSLSTRKRISSYFFLT